MNSAPEPSSIADAKLAAKTRAEQAAALESLNREQQFYGLRDRVARVLSPMPAGVTFHPFDATSVLLVVPGHKAIRAVVRYHREKLNPHRSRVVDQVDLFVHMPGYWLCAPVFAKGMWKAVSDNRLDSALLQAERRWTDRFFRRIPRP